MFIHPSLTSPWDISRSFIRQISPSTSVVRVSRGKGQTEATNPALVNLSSYFRGVSRGYFSRYKHAGERLTVAGRGWSAKVGQAAFDSKGGPRNDGRLQSKNEAEYVCQRARPVLSPNTSRAAYNTYVQAVRLLSLHGSAPVILRFLRRTGFCIRVHVCIHTLLRRGKTRRWNEIIYNRDASIAWRA